MKIQHAKEIVANASTSETTPEIEMALGFIDGYEGRDPRIKMRYQASYDLGWMEGGFSAPA